MANQRNLFSEILVGVTIAVIAAIIIWYFGFSGPRTQPGNSDDSVSQASETSIEEGPGVGDEQEEYEPETGDPNPVVDTLTLSPNEVASKYPGTPLELGTTAESILDEDTMPKMSTH